MHAVVIVDGQLHWQERPDPEAGDHELLVAVRAAGVNSADLAQRDGRYPAPPGWPPDIPGLEFAGDVVPWGGESPGSRRATASWRSSAAAPRRAGDGRRNARPGGAGRAFLAGGRRLHGSVRDRLRRALRPGAPHARRAAPGQRRRRRRGQRRRTACGAGRRSRGRLGARPRAARRRQGARGGRGRRARRSRRHGPFDVVLELVGAASLPAALEALATSGRIVVIGVGGGASFELDLLLLMRRRGRIFASTLRPRSRDERAVADRRPRRPGRALVGRRAPARAGARRRSPWQRLRRRTSASPRARSVGKLVLLA